MSDFLQTLSVPGAIWRMAGPNILISLIMLFYNITDTFFISLLHDDLALAAVGITFPCLTISLAVSSLLTVGSNSLVSRCIGAGDYAKASKTGSDIFGLALLTGLFLCIAGIILPLFGVVFADKRRQLPTFTVGLVIFNLLLCAQTPYIWFSLLSLPFIAEYSGERGAKSLKMFFYLFYPLHFACLYIIKILFF